MPTAGPQRQRKRKRTRLTPPSKSARRRATAGLNKTEGSLEESQVSRPPTEREFVTWSTYRSFVVKDIHANDEPVVFERNGYGLILPHAISPHSERARTLPLAEYWVGRILEIRSKGNNPSEVWARVEWLWSAADLKRTNRKIDTAPFGYMERFVSAHKDFVHSCCFQDIAHVLHFNERNTSPLPLKKRIDDETFYVRFTFDVQRNELKEEVSKTCICSDAYNPDTSPRMHFCPRRTCGRAFHIKCLQSAGHVDPSFSSSSNTAQSPTLQTPQTPSNSSVQGKGKGKGRKKAQRLIPRALQFERTVPNSSVRDSQLLGDIDTEVEIDATPANLMNGKSASQTPPPRKRGRPPRSHLSRPKEEETRTTFTRHVLLPPPLLALARSPMVRRDLPGDVGCVEGNVSIVGRARCIVKRVLDGGMLNIDLEGGRYGWVWEVGIGDRVSQTQRGRVRRKVEGNEERTIKEEVIEEDSEVELGSPMDGKEVEEEVLQWIAQDKGLLCPSCRGVI